MSKRKTRQNKGIQSSFLNQIKGPRTFLWALGFIFTGVATSLFTSIFDTWAIAIKNASKGFLRKYVDTYVIRAAGTELTDGVPSISLLLFILFWVGIWIFVKSLETEQHRIEKELGKLDRDVDNDKKSNVNFMIKESENLCRQQLLELKQNFGRTKKELKWIKWLYSILAVFSFYAWTLQKVSYDLVKIYRHDIIRVRPFMTDSEFHQLNRQWVMMKSRRDYKTIKAIISEYEKRTEADKKPDLENE